MGTMGMPATKALRIDKITVQADRIVAQTSVKPSFLYTTPELAKRVLEKRPNLAVHACINEKGPTFGAVIDHTPLPHLFEHIVVDILSQPGSEIDSISGDAKDVVVVGTSEWIDREKGLARVEVSYEDDLVALSALKEAEEFLNKLTS